jgi:hypothetical protein
MGNSYSTARKEKCEDEYGSLGKYEELQEMASRKIYIDKSRRQFLLHHFQIVSSLVEGL